MNTSIPADRACLEAAGSGPAPRDILEQEWWLAAIQEPAANFAPYEGDDWPATTLPAFEAAWCAFRQGEELGRNYNQQVRRGGGFGDRSGAAEEGLTEHEFRERIETTWIV